MALAKGPGITARRLHDTILGISIRQKKRHTTIRKMAKQQMSYWILPYMCHLPEDLIPPHSVPSVFPWAPIQDVRGKTTYKQLLVSAPVGGKRTVGDRSVGGVT